MTTRPDAIDMLDALAREAGFGAAESDAKPTAEELRAVEAAIVFARRELAKQARADVLPVATVVRPVRPSILAMTRDALIGRLRELQSMSGVTRLAVSHRHFNGAVSENDLRTTLEDLEAILDSIGLRGE